MRDAAISEPGDLAGKAVGWAGEGGVGWTTAGWRQHWSRGWDGSGGDVTEMTATPGEGFKTAAATEAKMAAAEMQRGRRREK